MKKEDVAKIVNENIEIIKMMLGLSGWRIGIEYGKIEIDGRCNEGALFQGRCIVNTGVFEDATITLDPDAFAADTGTREVLETLQHELVHCLTHCFSDVHDIAAELLDDKDYQVMQTLVYKANEVLVERICRILIGLQPLQYANLIMKCIGCGVGPRSDKPLVSLGICSDCFLRVYADQKTQKIEA